MVNPVIQKRILQILCKNTSKRSDFASYFIELEQYLFNHNIQNDSVLQFRTPYHPDFSLDISIDNGELEIQAHSATEMVSMKRHRTHAELYALGEKLVKMIDKEHVTLAPLPDEAFIRAILSAKKGTVINFNNQLGIICTKSNGNNKVFKQQFCGNLFDITLESFTKSDSYIIDTQNPKDLHFLYGKAFSSLTNTADVRISDEYMGQYLCTDIESRIPVASSKTIHIGPLKITAIKDSENKTVWYDGAGNRLDRDLVGMIFGWAKNTIPEVGVYDWNTNDIHDGVSFLSKNEYSDFLHHIKQYANTKQFDLLIEHAFRHIEPYGLTTFTIDDLEQDEHDNFSPVTYAFFKDKAGQHIYKFSYADGNARDWPKKLEEISKEEFIQFCEKKYDNTYHSLINKNEQTLTKLMASGLSKNQAEELIIEKIKERTDFNLLGITETDIESITNKITRMVASLSEVQSQLSAKEFVSLEELEESDNLYSASFICSHAIKYSLSATHSCRSCYQYSTSGNMSS